MIYWLKGFDGSKPPAEWNHLPDVLTESRVVPGHKEAVAHPSQKPLRLMERLIRFFSLPGAVILDPTCGSGSTCEAALRIGRHFIGFELNTTYAQMGRRRIENAQMPLGLVEET